MTQEDFIRMAREAGFVHANPHSQIIVRHSSGAWVSIEERLHQFFTIVAAAEREACAKLCDNEKPADPWKPVSSHLEGQFEMAGHLAERIRARGTL